MNHDERLRAQLQALCAELGPEDGSNARDFHTRVSSTGGRSHKQRQLCSQVARALALALASSSEPALRSCQIRAVSPSRNGWLEVHLRAPEPFVVLAALPAAGGWLRAQVAASIHRRNTPNLRFTVEGSDG
jgi:hypothetical protein